VSTVPAEIAGIGSTQQRLRVSPGFDPLKAQVGPEEYFVLSRIDGSQTLREVLLATGLPIERAVQIILKLRSIGALLLPNETATPSPMSPPARMVEPVRAQATPARISQPISRVAEPVRSQPTPARTSQPIEPVRSQPTPARVSQPVASPEAVRKPVGSGPMQVATVTAADLAPGHDLTLPHPSAEELAALTEVNDLDDQERRRILAIARIIDRNDPWALLGVRDNADAKDIKRAYFQLSKEIHPDRYYGKRLGSFAARMPLVFEATSRAYAKLTSSDKSKASGSYAAVRDSQQPQSPQAYAAELFDRACQLEVSGDHMGAMKLFAAAVRVDAQLRYLRRAASCALAAGQPRSAVEYAKKAHTASPTDPSSARLLAAAFRAVGNLSDAEEVLVMAMALKSENDALTSELRNDLAEVRRLLAQ
jgi:tetratricopeptide (TPR) repeat protein